MPGIMDIAKPLTQLMEEKQTFQWSLEEEAAVWSLKELLCMAPTLGYPQPIKKFIVNTDMSNMGIRGVMSQTMEGQEHVGGIDGG
jgi:hypothetical protein